MLLAEKDIAIFDITFLPKKVLPKEKYVTETLFTENQPNQ
jgi:hypothetical protein